MPDCSAVGPDNDATEHDTASTHPASEQETQHEPVDRRRLLMVVVPIIALVIASNIGDALATTLATSNPLALVALNARSRNLILVTNSLDAVSYYGVATLRLLLSDPLFFLLGMWYGDAAVTWMEKRTRTWGSSLRQMERWFHKAAYPLVFLAPNNVICLLAGAAGMSVTAFFVVNLAGTVVRLYAIRRFGEAFEAPIEDVLDFLAEYRIPLLILSIVLVAATSLFEMRRGGGEIEAVLHLEDDLEDDLDQPPAP